MTPLANLRYVSFAALPFFASCATMTQAELEQCAAVAQAKVEWESDEYDRWETLGQQPAVFVGHDSMAEMARHARSKIVTHSSEPAEVCPKECPTKSRGYDFGYTTHQTEKRVRALVEAYRAMNPNERRPIVSKCYQGLLQ